MMEKRTGLPVFWSTGIAKALVGEAPCLLSPWMKGHYHIQKVERDPGSLTTWKIRHTELLKAAKARFLADGWKVDTERYFRVVGQAAILSGKCDLVTQKADCRPTIRDLKGGEPQDSDLVQVQIYQVALPLAWRAPQMQFAGEVIYPTHTVPVTPIHAKALEPKLFALLRQLGSSERPVASPGPETCRWCDVSKADCPDRDDSDSLLGETDLF